MCEYPDNFLLLVFTFHGDCTMAGVHSSHSETKSKAGPETIVKC